ncbi:MAG: hypothetical protein ACOYN6_04905 [Ignavibacteria bacterium]
MNTKRIFGAVLIVLGIAGLIFTAIIFVDISGRIWDVTTLIIYGTIGTLLLISGIRLVRKMEGDL